MLRRVGPRYGTSPPPLLLFLARRTFCSCCRCALWHTGARRAHCGQRRRRPAEGRGPVPRTSHNLLQISTRRNLPTARAPEPEPLAGAGHSTSQPLTAAAARKGAGPLTSIRR
eukprot:COSAG04_NODE_582_length_12404_cov_81.591792_20_plen_113_part_00